MKLVVEERESKALLDAISGRGPYLTSVVGEIETARVCSRASVPQRQVDKLLEGLAVVALDDEVRSLAAAIGPSTLRTLDAIHLATALSLRPELDDLVAYDLRLVDAARAARLHAISPA